MNKIKIIGTGPGTKEYLLPVALREIRASDCLVGAKRILSEFRNLRKEKFFMDGNLKKVIPFVKKQRNKKKIAILVSGDSGLYSFLDTVSRNFKKEEYEVVPGISSLQLAFSRIGESWQDARIISLHGRDVYGLAEEVKRNKKVFLFTDNYFPPQKIAEHLIKNGVGNKRTVVFEQLGCPREKITDTTLEELAKMDGFKMCVMIVESSGTPRTPKLYGVGIGPGDPKLITLRAKEILDSVDTIFVPKGKEESSSCARTIIDAVITGHNDVVELVFPMTKDKSILKAHWVKAAKRIAGEIKQGKQAAFVTIGDPFIYSTYIYLLKTIAGEFPQIEVETIPGITSFNAAASYAGLPLVERNEKLAVLGVNKDLSGVKEAIEQFDTVILMKVGAKLDKIIELLNKMKRAKDAVLATRIGYPDGKIIKDISALKDKKLGYLSVIIVKRKNKKIS